MSGGSLLLSREPGLSANDSSGRTSSSSTAARHHVQRRTQSGSRLLLERKRSAMDVFELYCALAAVLGFVGFLLTLVAARDEACQVMFTGGSYREGTLTRWPSTISELNSDWASARGRLFFGFMLSTAGLLFASRMPYELDTVNLEEATRDMDGEQAAAHAVASESIVCCFADCGPACDWPCSK